MANPAPTINQINAFNATQGTTIDFNIIGGTELVRSNRIYIYDLSDNSLICTHLYVSTESIHELPKNTDGSIVYESGKSSADFVNGAQYYAQIQTFTDIGGTEGGSGLSVAKMFWCLVDPTLTITTIPSTISTTSYNVSAIYDANTSVVSNIIQQYQFSLYSATGSLLQSSGVVVGNGEQQGTSTAYDISYNFTGLNVGSSYYVTVEVTTTQGMSVSAQSNTFTVSIDTPTLGEATVVNNACDGYISVTSNLSGEYGGSGSGEIATFETDSVNDVSSLKVTLTPQQNGTPWIGTTHDTTPYLHRAMPTQSNDYNRESGVIVGGTVAWNQLTRIRYGIDSYTELGVTATNNSGIFELSGTLTTYRYISVLDTLQIIEGHKYLLDSKIISNPNNLSFKYAMLNANPKVNIGTSSIVIAESTKATGFGFENMTIGADYTGIKLYLNLFDLTAMFGSTIADYIYSLEQSQAGAGVAWFRKLFPKPYYAYNAGELMSVNTSAHNTVGFNQWDEEWELGDLNTSNGQNYPATNRIRSKNYIRVLPNTTYYFKSPYNSIVCFYDANKNFVNIGNATLTANATFTTKSNVHYMRISPSASYGTTYNHDICINFSDPSRNGEYEPYTKHSYPLDSSLTLRGIPKLDSFNNLYYDGDTYASDGSVTRNRAYKKVTANDVVLVSTASTGIKVATISLTVNGRDNNDVINNKGYTPYPSSAPTASGFIRIGGNNCYVYDNAFTDLATAKTLLTDLEIEYMVTAPTTETAQPYTNPQIVDPDGTEEYVTSGIVPVGHDSTYSLVCPISGYDSVSAIVSPTQDAEDGETYTTTLPQTVYGGTVDLVSGQLVVDMAMCDPSTLTWVDAGSGGTYRFYTSSLSSVIKPTSSNTEVANIVCSILSKASYGDVYAHAQDNIISVASNGYIYAYSSSYTNVSSFVSALSGKQLVYPLATPLTYQLTPHQIQTLVGQNNVWSEQGDVELSYHIPITNLLVKRQDVDDVSGSWLTLYSQPITQASDMDFTFIDFLNQYGKTYKYALVPLLTQTQSGVEVEVEGGYTVSDEVQSVFDGVFIADSTGSQKCKANVGYGNVDMNQVVGSITPIGAKYPIVITNSQNQYHNGSISGTIVPDDYYFNGNLSRIDMVNKRNELEQFLTNKRAKIIKDWNSNIWLVMILDNVSCTFNNNYGMGIVNFSTNWVEVGDPTNQQDLQATGLINVGGV